MIPLGLESCNDESFVKCNHFITDQKLLIVGLRCRVLVGLSSGRNAFGRRWRGKVSGGISNFVERGRTHLVHRSGERIEPLTTSSTFNNKVSSEPISTNSEPCPCSAKSTPCDNPLPFHLEPPQDLYSTLLFPLVLLHGVY